VLIAFCVALGGRKVIPKVFALLRFALRLLQEFHLHYGNCKEKPEKSALLLNETGSKLYSGAIV